MEKVPVVIEHKETSINVLTRGKCSKGDPCSFKHDVSNKGKCKGERGRTRSLSLGLRSPRAEDGKDASKTRNLEGNHSIGLEAADAVWKVPERNLHEYMT